MSEVTNLILTFSVMENERERIHEIGLFKYNQNEFVIISKDDPKLEKGWYGGNKMFEGRVYLSAYNHLELQEYISHLKTNVNWEYPEDVILLAKEQEDFCFKMLKVKD